MNNKEILFKKFYKKKKKTKVNKNETCLQIS